MIPSGMPEPNRHAPDERKWRHELRNAISCVSELSSVLGLSAEDLPGAEDPSRFPLRVPRSFAARMRPGDPEDPLLRQVLPLSAERDEVAGYSTDPVQELQFAAGGVVQKYARRVLFIATAACPVHCRYCFRRHFPYSEQLAARERWEPALAGLRNSPEIDEIILSGGDPLSLSTEHLAELIAALEEIDSVATLRIHTRFAIVLPSRITTALLETLYRSRLRVVVVVHSNHANELDDRAVRNALAGLHQSTDLLLNQSVLLRGVNDSMPALRELSKALFDARVMPYYLNLLDRVAGAAHFEVSAAKARKLMQQLRGDLPGYLVPKLVREEAGALSKTPLI